MNTTDTAKDYGNRIREHRNMLGWSQKTLADEAGVTYQAISKYEREGIHDIEMIHRLSEILGHNLLEADKDQEGQIGEIGQEILSLLIANCGVVHASYLLDGQQLYGLSSDDVLHELKKLKNIGMIVREQYIDFDRKEYDLVFITAKGIIAYKHLVNKSIDDSCNVKSYEQYCKNQDCYQEFIDADPAQSRINQLEEVGSYRFHLIRYIKNNYMIRPIGMTAKRNTSGTSGSSFGCQWLKLMDEFSQKKISARGIPDNAQHETIYQMIMQSMIRSVSKEKLDYENGPYIIYGEAQEMKTQYRQDLQQEEDELYAHLVGIDWEEDSLLQSLSTTMNIPYEVLDDPDPERKGSVLKKYAHEEYDKIKKRLEKIENQRTEADEFDDDGYIAYLEEKEGFCPEMHSDSDIFEYWSNLKGDPCPLNWFSKEEIETFIKANYLPASTDEEKAIESDIQLILTEKPYIATSYFKFPLEWELNGLADLVLDVFNVRHIFEKE